MHHPLASNSGRVLAGAIGELINLGGMAGGRSRQRSPALGATRV